MATLYDLSDAVRAVLDGSFAVDAETGEIFDSENFDELQCALDDKLEACAAYLRELMADVDSLKTEEARMAARRRSIEARAARFKRYMLECMEHSNVDKVKTARFSMWVGRSQSVDIIDVGELPERFTTTRTDVVVDKKAIRDALKAGEEVPGARLVTSTNLQVR